MNDLKEKQIVITSIENQTWGVKIKDEQNLVFNLSQFKKDTQDETVAWKTLNALPNQGMGMTKTLKFAEVANKMGGMSRYVRIISDDAPQSSYPIKSGQSYDTPNNPPTRPIQTKEDTILRSVAIKAVYPELKKMNDETIKEMDKVVEYIKTGKVEEMVNVEDNLPF